ncbi:MAG: hypothetical protein Q8Q10_02030 [bacterium]|nr:hypothetical protein [bacterium]
MFEQPQNPVVQPSEDPRNIQELAELNTREAIDKLSLETSQVLFQIDAFVDGKEKLPEVGTPIIQKYREAIKALEGKTPEELMATIDPEGKFNPQEFSLFSVSMDLPGAIHLEVGNSADLTRLRSILNKGRINLLRLAGIGDQREVETFGGQYYPPQVFAGGNYLGVIVTVHEHNQDQKTKEKTLKHEYSHALMQQVIRPLFHRKVVNIGLGDSLREIRDSIDVLGSEKASQLADALGIVSNPSFPEHTRPLFIGKDIYDEQYLLDELRAYTFNMGALYPKRQITDLSLEGEDAPGNAKPETVRKYFEVNLLHTKARITSRDACARSLAILGSTLSLDQARRLLEQDSKDWKFNEGDNDEEFESTFDILNKIFNDPQYKAYRDFGHKEGGELVTQNRMREVVLPSKEMVDKEIARRYGSMSKIPEKFQQHYSAVYNI